MNLPLLFLSPLVGAAIALLCVKLHALTLSGGIASAVTVAATLALGGISAFSILLFSFFTISLVGKLTKKKRRAVENGIPEKEGARDAVQVAVNGAPAVVSILLYSIFGSPCFFYAFIAALAEALSDSMASEIGVLSKSPPRDICRGTPLVAGMSGGVSALGCLAAVGGAALTVLFSAIFPMRAPLSLLLALLSALLGVLFDSVLGSLVQAKFRCRSCGKATEKRVHCGEPTEHTGGIRFLRNDLVNLLSGTLAAVIACLLTAGFPT